MQILYVLLEDSRTLGRGTVFHTIPESEVLQLRSLMALLLLPADTEALRLSVPVFTAAYLRYHYLPVFRKAPAHAPPPTLLEGLLQTPLAVFLASGEVAPWVRDLAARHPRCGLLTPNHEVAGSVDPTDFSVGVLRGTSDLHESYRVLRELIAARLNLAIPPEERSHLSALADSDLLQNRPRLSFLPALSVPPPEFGRAAAYLLNRLSNSVEEPSLMAPEQAMRAQNILPGLLDYSLRASLVLTAHESGKPFPPDLPLDGNRIREAYEELTAPSTSDEAKLRVWTELGRSLAAPERPRSGVLVTVPAARGDILRGRAPGAPHHDPPPPMRSSAIRQVLRDIPTSATWPLQPDSDVPSDITALRETARAGHRLLAIHSAMLASRTHAIPLQLPDVGHRLYHIVANVMSAIAARSRKTARLFRALELALAQALPPDMHALLAEGHSPVTFYSDLPFEWTAVNDFPLCMSRPVSRIPIGRTNWSVLTNRLEASLHLDVTAPERVLVLDLISAHDAIRSHSEDFQAVAKTMGHHYTYRKPTDRVALAQVLAETLPDVVVLDAHASYDPRQDRLALQADHVNAWADEYLPDTLLPPVWILSACDTSVVGSIRGTLVRELLERGAVCVVATLCAVDAFTAALFVGRLLADIYSPPHPGLYTTLSDAILSSQLTTALLYDPLMPLLRLSQRDASLREPLALAIGGYLREIGARRWDARELHLRAAEVLAEQLDEHGLTDLYRRLTQSREATPETLLFTAFGLPQMVQLHAGASPSQR